MMDHPSRAWDGLPVLQRLQLLHYYFAAFQRGVRLSSPLRRQAIDPQKIHAAP
jgi:hypothetical protein